MKLNPKWDVPIKSLPSRLREPRRKRGGKNERATGGEEHQENKALKEKIVACINSKTGRPHAQGLHGSAPGTLHIMAFSLVCLWDS